MLCKKIHEVASRQVNERGHFYNGEVDDVMIDGEPGYKLVGRGFTDSFKSILTTLVATKYYFDGACTCGSKSKSYCPHIVTLSRELIEFEKDNPITYTTRRLNDFMKHINTDNKFSQEPIQIVPDLEVDYDYNNQEFYIKARFKIGNKKLYRVKDFNELTNLFDKKDEKVYGKNFSLIHDYNLLDPKSKDNYSLIEDASGSSVVFSANEKLNLLVLKGSLLDRFYDINFGKNYDVDEINLDSSLIKNNGFYEFEFNMDRVYNGKDYCYIVDSKNKLHRCDKKYAPLKLLAPLAVNPYYSIDEGDMEQFYRTVYKVIDNVKEVKTDVDMNVYKPLELEIDFFFDENEEGIILDYDLKYKDHHSLLLRNEDYTKELEKERAIFNKILEYFDTTDSPTHFVILSDEALFNLLDHGIDEFNRLGKVYASSKFKRLSVFKKPNMGIGISVQSDSLLKLNLDLDGIDYQEITEIMKSYKFKKQYHRLKSGEFLLINDEDFKLIEELTSKSTKELKALVEGNLQIPAYRGLYIDSLLKDSSRVDYNVHDSFKNLLTNYNKTVEVPLSDSFNGELRNYQKEGYDWLVHLDHNHFGGVLADDMGLGKTIQMIAFILSKKQKVLIVTPASLVYNWQNEFKRFSTGLNVVCIAGNLKERKELINQEADVYITSYDLLKRDITLYENITFDTEVIDEAQYIKNASSLQAKAVKAIHAKNRFALSGTPIENRLSELWSIFDYLMPGLLYDYKTFKDTFEKRIVKEEDQAVLKALHKRIHPFILRRKKEDVLKDLPDKLQEVVYSNMGINQQKVYKDFTTKLQFDLMASSDQDFNKSKIQVLAALTRLRQLCCDPNLCIENYIGESCKLDTCIELIQSGIEGNHKILLFSQFTSMLSIIENRLIELNIPYYKITGETPKTQRIQYVDSFNSGNVPVFLISLKAGGTGLNLTSADIVIHYDPWWNEAAMNQATDRAHRIGQQNIVTEYKLICKDTIEEQILKLQGAKSELAKSILEGGSIQIHNLTKQDILEIIN